MLQELLGKTVKIYLGDIGSIGGLVLSGSSYHIKGQLMEYRDPWLKVQTKSETEFINVAKITRISASLM